MVVLFFVLFVFVVVLWFVFLVLFGFLFCFLLAALGQLDGLRKGPHSLSFAAFLSDGFACFSQFISEYKLVERPSESYEGVGRKKQAIDCGRSLHSRCGQRAEEAIAEVQHKGDAHHAMNPMPSAWTKQLPVSNHRNPMLGTDAGTYGGTYGGTTTIAG